MSDREAMKEALRLLTKCAGVSRLWQVTDACDILRARLAAPEPEPVAYFDLQKQVFYWSRHTIIDVPMTVAVLPLPLYAAPPDTEALRRDAAIQERRVSHGEAAIDAAMDASTAPSAAAVDALKEPAMQPAIRAQGEVPR